MDIEALKYEITQVELDTSVEPDPFEELETILDRAYEQNMLPLVVSTTEPALSKEGVDPARYYLYAVAQMRLGNPDESYRAVLPLASRLEQQGHWRALGLLAGRALESSPRTEAALQIAKAYESAGFEILDPAYLQRAYDNFPGESRLAYLMGEWKSAQAEKARENGDGGDGGEVADKLMSEARFFWAESLDGLVSHKKNDAVDEVILKIADSDNPANHRQVLRALKKLSEQSAWGRFNSALDISLPGVKKVGLSSEIWQLLLHLLPSAPASVGTRKLLADLAPEAFPEAEGIVELLTRTGIFDPEKDVEAAMKALEPLIAFVPGFFVLHASWGIGKIEGNDGEALIIDFEESAHHRMSVNLARRALQVVPNDDLRVQMRENPDEVKALVKQDPAEIAYLGIRQLRSQAKTQDLKRALIACGVMTSSRWTTWWKEAKSKMEDDGRFDLSQAFRQVYKIRTGGLEGNGAVTLPAIEPRRGVRPNLNLIRRFLEQHPNETQRAARTYRKILARWARGENIPPEDRMAIHLQLHRWSQETNDDFHDALREMLHAGTEAFAFSGLEDQILMVSRGLEYKDLWKETVWFGLSSRYPDVRDLGLRRLAENLESGQAMLRGLIQDPAERPLAALSAINLSLKPEDEYGLAPDVWEASLGAATLVEATSREQVRKLALGLLSPEGILAAKMAKVDPGESLRERWEILMRRWRSSERYLQPILNVLRQAGLGESVERFRTERIEQTNRMLASRAQTIDYSGTFMTRPTFARLREEVERLNYELKTTVAQAIGTAREHGDLRENAEYDAAKKKQADWMERIGTLTKRLETARMIEDLEVPENEVAPGTFVELEDVGNQERQRFWILGEGDDVLGQDIISYASPMGRSLLGKKVEERVSLVKEDGVTELIIRSVTRKLPAESDGPAESL